MSANTQPQSTPHKAPAPSPSPQAVPQPALPQQLLQQQMLLYRQQTLLHQLVQQPELEPPTDLNLSAGWVGMAQINTTPGDLLGNSQKILRHYQRANAAGMSILVCPELCLMGYPMRDVITRYPAVVTEQLKYLRILARQTEKTALIIGFVEPNPKTAPGKPYFNAAAILHQGKIVGIVRKQLLPTYDEYEEYRTFQPANEPASEHLTTVLLGEAEIPILTGKVFELNGMRVGVSICEDAWSHQMGLYAHDPIEILAKQQPDVLLNLSASVSREGRLETKQALFEATAKRWQLPILDVNLVGSVDECCFDGQSLAYDATGRLIAKAPAFEETLWLVHPKDQLGIVESGFEVGDVSEEIPTAEFNPHDERDLPRTYASVLQGIRDYFKKSGFSRAVLGLSGGLDSAVTATLLVDALGKENVLGVTMPSTITPTDNQSDAEMLAKQLGIACISFPIADACEPFLTALQTVDLSTWGAVSDHPSNVAVAEENVQAISRATYLRLLGNVYNALPIATSDKSELYLGYATVNGDMTGALAPLGDIPKTKVFALGRWINANILPNNRIPQTILERPPGADLALDPNTGETRKAEDALMPYEFADEIIWRLEVLHQSKEEILNASFYWEAYQATLPANFQTQQKVEWVNRFFTRMRQAVFKWWLIPPILIQSKGSITKTSYHQPIITHPETWTSRTEAEICEQLLS